MLPVLRHLTLVVDDDPAALQVTRSCLNAAQGFDLDVAPSTAAARTRLQARPYDLLIVACDNGTEVLELALMRGRARRAVAVCAAGAVDVAVRAMRAGAADVLTRPYSAARLLEVAVQAMGPFVDPDSFEAWRARYAPSFIGSDPRIVDTLRMVQRIADTDCDVLITGASGTGKELVARCIHLASRRSKNPFVALNCAAIPKDLMESEIFGHARGAFTGATDKRGGRFEAAAGGTLFLDETGEMDLALQSKFLRVIQEREVTPVGESRSFKVDVRIISATNQNLDILCREKLFREDLYYRLNVIPVHLPALAERPSDITVLAQHFIERANRRHGRHVCGLDDAAAQALASYDWPGNVRELQNLVERIVILKNDDGLVNCHDLPPHINERSRAPFVADLRLPEAGLDINEALAVVETRLTLDALERAKGNKARAAELLGLKRTTLVERLKKLHLDEGAGA